MAYAPYSLEAFDFPEERRRASTDSVRFGLAIPPDRRLRFENDLKDDHTLAPAVKEASDWILSQLVSSPRHRASIFQQKLAVFLSLGHQLRTFSEWTQPHAVNGLEELPAGVSAALDPVFDFPGFRQVSAGSPLRFRDLMPRPWNPTERISYGKFN